MQIALKLGALRIAVAGHLATSVRGDSSMAPTKRKKLGEVLRDRGSISSADLSKALEEPRGKVIHLGELLLERGLVSKPDLVAALAEVTRVPYVDCSTAQVDLAVLKQIPRNVAQRCCVFPLAREGPRLVTVMAEPQNLGTLGELRFTSGLEIAPRLGFRAEINAAIERYYAEPESAKTPATAQQVTLSVREGDDPEMEFISTSSRQSNLEAMQELQAELIKRRTPAVRLVSSMILAAMDKHASDIHVEPQATDTIVRIRVDGVLRDLQRIPRALQNSLISRIKILSDMDIAERRAPQDGRFLVKMAEKMLDLRVSSLPTQYGEKVVMRLLEPDAPLRGFSELGLSREIEESLARVLQMPQGMLLVTGPTGSGKSTTLYACLNVLRRPAVNIVTVEDPVEYAMAGINQVHVNTKAGLTFASCLRSILRQDPNVIMVGEIRDRETAEIALKAAQTGHLVLSTLHTNDSIAAISRLLDLEVPGFLIASSISGIIAQRLVRRLCSCHKQVPVTADYATQLLQAGLAEPVETQHVPVGCDTCDQTGYKGRIGIYEMLVLDENIRTAVRSGGRNDEIRSQARSVNMKMMQEYALEYVRLGMTTLEEVRRVVPLEAAPGVECSGCGRVLATEFLFCPYCGTKTSRPGGGPRVVVRDLAAEGAVRI
jgi:type IV pilus assembly protein PilB